MIVQSWSANRNFGHSDTVDIHLILGPPTLIASGGGIPLSPFGQAFEVILENGQLGIPSGALAVALVKLLELSQEEAVVVNEAESPCTLR